MQYRAGRQQQCALRAIAGATVDVAPRCRILRSRNGRGAIGNSQLFDRNHQVATARQHRAGHDPMQ
jgi:hypothetical protein